MISRDKLIREYRTGNATLPAVLVVYSLIVAAMILSGLAMT